MDQYHVIGKGIICCHASYQEMKEAVKSVLQNGKQGEI